MDHGFSPINPAIMVIFDVRWWDLMGCHSTTMRFGGLENCGCDDPQSIGIGLWEWKMRISYELGCGNAGIQDDMIGDDPKISKNRFQYSTKWFASGLGRPRSLCAAGQLACHHLSWGYRWGLCTNDQFGAGEAIKKKKKLGKASLIVEIQHLQMIAMFDLRRVLESLREIGFRPPIWTSKLSAHCQCPRLWPISSSSLVVSQWNISENGCICRYGNVRVWLRVCLPTSQIIVRFSWKFGSLGVRSNYFGILKIPRTPKTQNKNPLVSLAAKDHPCPPSFH